MKPLKTRDKEVFNGLMSGRWRDKIYRKDPETGVVTLIEDTDWSKNTIVNNFGVLVAALLANDYLTEGIQFHAIGSGDVSWDTSLPTAASSQDSLTSEVIRKVPDQIVFLDQYDATLPAGERSNKIEIRTTFDFTDGPAAGFFIREQGLFGGDATAAADSGLMLNAINNNRIFKNEFIRIVRFIALEIRIPTVP